MAEQKWVTADNQAFATRDEAELHEKEVAAKEKLTEFLAGSPVKNATITPALITYIVAGIATLKAIIDDLADVAGKKAAYETQAAAKS